METLAIKVPTRSPRHRRVPENSRLPELDSQNRAHSEQFILEEPLRRQYRIDHPVEVLWGVCSDPRHRPGYACEMPIGVSQTLPNVGAEFSLLWLRYRRSIESWFECVAGNGRIPLYFITSHFSASGDPALGCRAHGGSKNRAYDVVFRHVREIRDMFTPHCDGVPRLFAVPGMFETDTQALVLRSVSNPAAQLDAAEYISKTSEEIRANVHELYRREIIRDEVRTEIADFFCRNVRFVEKRMATPRPKESLGHREDVILLHRGGDWLMESAPHTAFVISTFDPRVEEHLVLAAEIVLENLERRRARGDARGAVLILSSPYRATHEDPGRNEIAKNSAVKNVEDLLWLSTTVLKAKAPELFKQLSILPCVVDNDTRRIERINRDIDK